jgi:hypothetical protein
MERVPVEERARRYVAKMPVAISGSGGHDATFTVACVLVRGFDLSPDAALPIMREWNQGCQPPWADRDLIYKLNSANRSGTGARGYLLAGTDFRPSKKYLESVGVKESEAQPAKPAALDVEWLLKVAGDWSRIVDVRWLANRSWADPAQMTSHDYLAALYGKDERVLVFTDQRSQGQALWPDDRLPERGEDGVWYLPQPVDGVTYMNPRTGNRSRRSEESVTAFRYLVLESDEAPVRPWLGLLVQLPARIEAIYTSGGRSVHALVRVDCASKAAWDAEKQRMRAALGMLFLGGLDKGVLSAVRLSRLPGCYRASKKGWQKLLYIQPHAELRPIIDRAPSRDVERYWSEQADAGISDADETGGEHLKRALNFYAPVSPRLAAALNSLTVRAHSTP